MPQQIKKNPGGRPPIIFSPKQIKKVQELSQSLTIAQIADYFGISQSTFYQIQRRRMPPPVSLEMIQEGQALQESKLKEVEMNKKVSLTYL